MRCDGGKDMDIACLKGSNGWRERIVGLDRKAPNTGASITQIRRAENISLSAIATRWRNTFRSPALLFQAAYLSVALRAVCNRVYGAPGASCLLGLIS